MYYFDALVRLLIPVYLVFVVVFVAPDPGLLGKHLLLINQP